jgi:hypothetical protein
MMNVSALSKVDSFHINDNIEEDDYEENLKSEED